MALAPGSTPLQQGGTGPNAATTSGWVKDSGQSNATNDTGNQSNASLPPGVSQRGVTNASALVAAHERTLARTGFEFTFRQNSSFGTLPTRATNFTGTGFAATSDQRGSVAAGLAPSLTTTVARTTTGNQTANVTSETWANETLAVTRTTIAGVSTVQRRSLEGRQPARAPRPQRPGSFRFTRDGLNATLTQGPIVGTVLRSGSFAVTDVNRTGNRTLTTLRATAFTGSDVLNVTAANVSEYAATLVVDDRGVVRRLRFSLSAPDQSIRYLFVVNRTGPVEVTPPRWVQTELGGSGTQNATAGSRRVGDGLRTSYSTWFRSPSYSSDPAARRTFSATMSASRSQ